MTLGKRISAGRKRLGLTQDQLAERLGVTAQAVSKWENDQSCPDITTLPRLAELLGTTTDALLGRTATTAYEAEVENTGSADIGVHWDHGRKALLSFAVLVLLVGSLMLLCAVLGREVSFWSIAWPSALLILGANGLWERFSFFSVGCVLFGGYFLLENLEILDLDLSGKLILPIILLIFGLSLLMDALRKPKARSAVETAHRTSRHYEVLGDRFSYSSSFGEQHQMISLPRLSGGEISVSFGDYELDLSEVTEAAPNCRLEAKCSFGELTLLIPRRFRVQCDGSTAFASIDTSGHPDPEPAGTIIVQAEASFGQIQVRYI